MTRGLGTTPPTCSQKDGGSNADEQKKSLPVATVHGEEKGVIANLGPGVAAAGAVMMGGFYGADILGYVSGSFQSAPSQHRPILSGNFVVLHGFGRTHTIGKRCVSNSGADASSSIADAMHQHEHEQQPRYQKAASTSTKVPTQQAFQSLFVIAH
jgi:hypothetical protein